MRMSRPALLVFFSVIVWCSVAAPLAFSQTKPNHHVDHAARERDLDALVRRLVEQSGAPGVQAVVVKDGKIVWSGSYGDAVRDVPGPPRPMREDFFMSTCSSGKIPVVIAVMQQVEKGKFSLDDDINRYAPFPVRNPRWPDTPITWRMLLAHTSSIDEVDSVTYDSMYVYGKDDPQTFEDYMKERFEGTGRFKGQNLYRVGKPGTERIYSNDGISLAALALENIVHKSFATYVQNEIFAPLKMHDTSYSLAPLPVDRLSVGYLVEREPNGRFSYLLQRTFLEHKPPSGNVSDNQISFPDYPSGRTYTTATDYARLMIMLMNGGTLDGVRILNQSSVDSMISPSGFRNLDGWTQGLGVFGPKDLRGRQVWGHVGEDQSCSSALFFNPDTRVGVIVLANGNYPDFTLDYALGDLNLHLMSWFEDANSKLEASPKSAALIEKLKLPGPDAQTRLLGSWSIRAEGSSDQEDLASGRGTELWYSGPGGQSLIEELHVNDCNGRPIDAFGPAWWDPSAQGQRFLWCANNLLDGCLISENVMRWENDRYVYREDREASGQKTRHEEVFSDITERSFLQTLLSGPPGKNPTSTWIAKATKLQTDLPRMSFHAPPTGVSSQPDINKLIQALSGSWSIALRFAPNEQMPKGASGTGEETWRAGPGGLSVIEEYHSTGEEGEVSGLGIFWPDKQMPRMQTVWCDSIDPTGCSAMSGGARWDGNQVVVTSERGQDGRTITFKEVFSDITDRSFTQTVYEGASGGSLQPSLTIHAARKTTADSAPATWDKGDFFGTMFGTKSSSPCKVISRFLLAEVNDR